jgi:hypothetical protein
MGHAQVVWVQQVERQLVSQARHCHVEHLALGQCSGPDGSLCLVGVGLDHVGGLPRWEGCELVGGGLGAEEVGDLADHPARRLGRRFTLQESPDPVADLLLGALVRFGVLLGLGGQLVLVERHQGEEPFRHVLHNRLVAPGAELADGCRLGSAFRPSLTGFAWSSLAKPPMIHPEGSACSKA